MATVLLDLAMSIPVAIIGYLLGKIIELIASRSSMPLIIL